MFKEQVTEVNKNKILNSNSITVNRNPNLDNYLSSKNYVVDSIGEYTIVRIIQTSQNYLKVSVGNDKYNLTKYDETQIIDTTIKKYPNTGGDLLQNWILKCNDKNHNREIENFIKSTKTNSPTGYSGATSLSPIGRSFLKFETSSNNHCKSVFVSFDWIDIIQITSITFFYNRFSSLNKDSSESMGCSESKLLLKNDTWSTWYDIPKIDRYSASSNQWMKLSLNYTVENYGIKLIYDEIDSAHADMCFSNITITHSIY